MALYESPRDTKLADLVRAAVHACNRCVTDLENAGKYIGSHSMGFPRSVKAGEHGWPSVSTAVISGGPTDFAGPFGPTAGAQTQYAYDDVAELSEVIEYMLSDTNLVGRLNLGLTDEVDRFTKVGAGLFVTGILDRARHTVGREISNGVIDELYLEVEPTLFLDRLPIDIVVPVVLTSFDIDDAVEIAPGLRIERMTDGLNRARNLEFLRNHDVNPFVANAATHAVVLASWEMPWPDPWYHQESHWPIDVIDRALRAIELADPKVVPGYAQILIRPLGWADRWKADLPPLLKGPTLIKHPPSFADVGWNTAGTHFDRECLDDAGSIFQRLDESPRPVSIAMRRLGSASLRGSFDDQIIDLCIGLEALCGDRGEVTYKLKMRVAALLAITGRTGGRTTADLMSGVKRIYDLRSRLVHGDEAGKYGSVTFEDGSEVSTLDLLTELVRSAVLSILERPDLADLQLLDRAMIEAVRDVGEHVDRNESSDGDRS